MSNQKNQLKTDKVYGFDLKSVTWGYREIFRNMITRLHRENLLGKDNRETTGIFNTLLNQAGDNSCFDQVLKNFLEALNSEHNWIMKLPALFSDWCDLGSRFAENKLYMGVKYFEIWGKGGFGDTPEEVRFVLDKANMLFTIDVMFAYKFIEAYRKLRKRLSPREVETFLEYSRKLYARSPRNAYTFLQLKTKTSREYLKIISRETRLQDISDRLERIALSVSGREIKLADFSELDSDDLIERGSNFICLGEFFYYPARSDFYRSRHENRDYYFAVTVIGASTLAFKSFPLIHGTGNASTSYEFICSQKHLNPELVNRIFMFAELYRILSRIKKHFPGIGKLIRKQIRADLDHNPNLKRPGNPQRFILNCFSGRKFTKTPEESNCLEYLRKITAKSENLIDTLENIEQSLDCPETSILANSNFLPLGFFPDFMFPGTISDAPESGIINDLKNKSPKKHDKDDSKNDQDGQNRKNQKQAAGEIEDSDASGDQANKDKNTDVQPVGYYYDEWNEHEKDYLENWCCLRERFSSATKTAKSLSPEYQRYSREVKRLFERLKPDIARKERYLREGDNINIDMLVEYISQRKAKIIGREDFYEKPFINKRDITVALLIDLSGSTGEKVDQAKSIIELEKESAYILSEGLNDIGDRFGVFGFTGNGRMNAEFRIFKDFDSDWNQDSQQSLLNASPGSSTRIGVAVRHAGYKLKQVPSRQKILLLITDGKPMDSEYDPNSRYAQYDVRRANEENYREGIDSFCISTEENKIEDLEIMFPYHRYVIIRSMKDLPRILSRLYLKITK